MSWSGQITAVKEAPIGSELTEDVASGATSLPVLDLTQFDLNGGGRLQIGPEIHFYSYDDVSGELVLGTPLASPYLTGDPVLVDPPSIERVAFVASDDQEEPLEVRVPHYLYDRIATGIREDENSSEGVVYDMVDDELMIVDVLGLPPTVDGSYIDAETLPPPVADTDGDPPALSPAPHTVAGGTGFLVPQWTLISNPDPVTYEVHIDLMSGFTPSEATKAGETSSSIFYIRSLPNGDPLLYPTEPDLLDQIYYIRLVAKDADGAAAPGAELGGQLRRINSPDIAADAVIARHLIADEAMFARLQSLLVITNVLKTAESGARIELGQLDADVSGLRAVMADENLALEFSTSTGQARFYGDLIASTATILGNLLIQGTTNKVDGGGNLMLSGQQPADPVTPLTATIDNDKLTLEAPADPILAAGMLVSSAKARGIFWDAAGYNPAGGTQATILSTGWTDDAGVDWDHSPGICIYEHRASDGVHLRSFVYGKSDWSTVCGIARIGSLIWVLVRVSAHTTYLVGFNPAAPTEFPAQIEVTTYTPQVGKPWVALSTDGTNALIYGADGTTASEPMRRVTVPLAGGSATHVDYTGITFSGRSVQDSDGVKFMDAVRVSGIDWVIHSKGNYMGANSWNASTLALETETGFACQEQGITYDGVNRFYSRAANVLTKHTIDNWAGTEKYRAWAYTWLNSGQTQETKAGARTFMDVRQDPSNANRALRRNQIKLTGPAFPSGVARFRIYSGMSTTTSILDSALKRQAPAAFAISGETAWPTKHIYFDNAGANPPATQTWPAGDSSITTQAQGMTSSPHLTGKGMIRKGRVTTTQRTALTSLLEAEEVYDTTLDMPLWYDGSAWRGALELVDLAHARVKFGRAQTAVFGSTPAAGVTFAHGMGAEPLVVVCTVDRTGGGGAGFRLYTNASCDATNITLMARSNNDSNLTGSCFIWWLAIWT